MRPHTTRAPTPALTAGPETDAKFASILAIAADAIITVDETQRIIHFNRGAEEIFGYTAAEAVGQSLQILLPRRHWATHPAQVRAFAAGPDTARRMGERREIFGVRKDGTEFPAEASISKLTLADGRMVFTAVLRDVTERKRSQESERFLSESGAHLARSLEYEEVLRAIVNLPVPHLADAATLDVLEEDEIRHITSGAGETAGEPEVARLVVPLQAGTEAIGALTLISTSSRRELGDEARAIATKFAFSAALSLRNARLYGETQRAKQARDDVLGVVSHDLRNPMSAIAMCARVLLNAPPDGEKERRDLIDTIIRSTEWVDRMIQDLVDVANLERGQLSLDRQPEEPGALVSSALEMFDIEARDHDLRIVAEVESNLPAIDVDGARIVQVLSNLIRNAVKFTPDGGTITVNARRDGSGVLFAVSDTGPGIAADVQERIFDRYWQNARGARKRGSGLGLSIAKGLVDAHGGRISVDSAPGIGSTFVVVLPSALSG